MASVTTDEIKTEARFMKDLWIFIKKFYIPEDSEEYWHNVVVEANELVKKYGDTDFIRHMTLSFIDYLEKMHRKKRELSK